MELGEVRKTQVTGIGMDLRLDEYVRAYIPVFIVEKTLPDNWVDLFEELEAMI